MSNELNITVKHLSHSTLKLPKRVIDNIKWIFSGEKRVRVKQK